VNSSFFKKFIKYNTHFTGFTLSADSTSHRINYNSRHVNLVVESSGNLTEMKKHVTCFLGIDASTDGSSEQAIKDYDRMFEGVFKICNNSPLGKKDGKVM